ncbi:MAG: hypothetical protein AAF471_02585, partial [Myxococcota bacterium]
MKAAFTHPKWLLVLCVAVLMAMNVVLLPSCSGGARGDAEKLSVSGPSKKDLQKSCEEYGDSDPEYKKIEEKVEKGEEVEPKEYNRDKKSCDKLPHCTWWKNEENQKDGVCVKTCDKLTP